PLWSTAMPARLENVPCGAVLPSIDDRKLPSASNFKTMLLPVSPTNTLFADGPGDTPTAMVVGRENWPGPEPGIPAWHVWDVQTSLCAAPSVTPHPHAAMKLPLASNFTIRAFPVSATYMAPFVDWIAIPVGVWSSPLPEPGLPNVLDGLNKDAHAVVAPGATPSTQTAKTTAATRAGSRRTRYQLLRKDASLSLSATRS